MTRTRTGTAFGGASRTDSRGEFTLARLTPGWQYEVTAVSESRRDHQPMMYHQIASVRADNAKPLDLGEVELGDVYNPPTLTDLVDEFLQSPRKPADRLQSKLRDARLTQQRVLLFAGSRKSEICRQFVALYYRLSFHSDSGHSHIVQTVLSKYAILSLDMSDDHAKETRQFLESLKLSAPRTDDATFAIFDGNGSLIAATTGKQLLADSSFSGRRLVEFLNPHAPSLPHAAKLLSAALSRAKREQKRVLVHSSTPFSAGGLLLSRYLDAQQRLLEKDYVCLRLDPRFENSTQVTLSLGQKPALGELFVPVEDRDGHIEKIPSHLDELPWMAILDADGKPLATSDGPEGNIGFPAGRKRTAHFRKMLRETARRLDDAEIQMLVNGLNPPDSN